MNKTLGQRFFHILQKEKKLENSNSVNNLPSISLNQLEKQVYDFKKKKNLKQTTDGSIVSNNKQLNVCSPFYDRMKTHKQNCKCPYHRKKPLSVISVKRSEKKAFIIKKSVQKIKQSKEEDRLQRFSNKQPIRQQRTKVLFKSLECIDKPRFTRSQNSKTKQRVDTRNFSYEMFLKDCEYHLLKKRGFSTDKPTHIIRKGIKQIFEFINSHLDWNVEKMRQWIQGFQKDRDYGEFYIDRFRDMKNNYELAMRRKRESESSNANQGTNAFGRQSNYTNPPFEGNNNRRYKSMNNDQNDQQEDHTSTTDLIKKGSINNNLFKTRHIDSNQFKDNDKQQQTSNILAQQYLNKIFNDLRDMNFISSEVTQALMGLGFKEFNQIFERLQKNIANNVYTDQMLAKLDNGVIGELLKISFDAVFKGGKDMGDKKDVKTKKYNINSQKESEDTKDKEFKFNKIDFQQKLNVIKKTQIILKKHRSRKFSNLSQRTSGHANNNSKHLLGSKKNTEDTPGQNARSATIVSHSKKSSNGDFSLNGSLKNIDSQKDVKIVINGQKPFRTIEEALQIDEQHLNEDQRRRLMALGFLGPHVRRSKMMRPGQIFSFLRQGFKDDDNDDDYHFRKKSVELKRGFFTKAEKYLFDMNMDEMIIKNDDSLITAKRKMRVIKMVLKESPHAPEADVLKNYVKQIEEKISMKSQKQKNLEPAKGFQVKYMKDQEIWNSISLQNMGFDLIFYNISSQIRAEDSEDLCIMLNDWKLINMRRLQNRISYKMDLMIDEDELNKKKRKAQISDVLVQEDMRNMKFEPKMDSFINISPYNQSKVRNTFGKKYSGAISTAKDSKMSGFFSQNTPIRELKYDEHSRLDDEQQRECYNNRIKGMFKYAKAHLPETFGRYVKNCSLNNCQQDNSLQQI